MIAFVRSVTFAAASSMSRLSVAGSISAKTGVARLEAAAIEHQLFSGARRAKTEQAYARDDDFLVGGLLVGDTHRLERDNERLRTVGDTNRALHPEMRRGLFLERPVVLAADELARLEHSLEGGLELGDQRPVLGAYVNERDRLHSAPL